MARLRLVGRPGRRFGRKGHGYVDGDRSGGDGEGDDRKGRLVVSVHRGLRDFVAIAGGDSDVEEGFRGFTDDEIQLVIKRTSEALALVRSSEYITASSVDKISGRLRQRVQQTTAKPFLQLVKSHYNRHLFLTSIPLAATKRHTAQKSFLSSSMSESSSKPMKGSIKVRLLGKGFLVKKQETRSLQPKEKSKSKEGKVPQRAAAVELQREKPRKKTTKILKPKTVGRSIKDALLKQKRKRLTDRSRAKQLADSRRQGKLSSELSTESPPKKRGFIKCNSATKTKNTFAGQRKSAKTLNRHARRTSESAARRGREGDEGLLRPFSFPSESKDSHRNITTSKEFPEDSSASELKKHYIHDTTFDEREFVADQGAPDAKPGILLLNKSVVPDVLKKIPMFDAPLICDSKRCRKPAQKLIMKWSEDYDLNLKRKSLDVSTAGIETSSGDEAFDSTSKSAKNNRTAQFSSQSLSVDEPRLLISNADLCGGHDGASDAPLSPSLVLMQKNEDLGDSWPEREDSKPVRMRKYCCICLGSHKLSRYIGCRSLCCQHCYRFYSSKAKLVMKGSLDLLCVSGGCCTIHWKTLSSCDACKYRKCLEYFLPPEEAVNMTSVHKGDAASKRERHQSEFPLAPIAKDSPWNAELVKFLKASEVQEELHGAQDKSEANFASHMSATSLDPGLNTGPSRRLCKFGKSRTIVTRSSDIAHEMIEKSDTSFSVLRIPNLLQSSFSDSNNFADGVKLCETEADEKLKSDENLECWTSQVEDLTGDVLSRCEVEPCGARTLAADQPSVNAPLIASPKTAAGRQQQGPDRLLGKGLEFEGRGGEVESEGSEQKGDGRGPRIKHVCRKADMVLGKPPAVFPSQAELCLSALPSQEKDRILQNEDNSQGSSDVDETSAISKEQTKDGAEAEAESVSKRSISKKSKTTKQACGPKKTMRCRNCVGCLTPECGVCTACKDMPKNGGRGTLKHACIHRVCRNPILPWHKLSPEKLAKARLEKELEAGRSVAGSTPKKTAASHLQTSSAFNQSQGRPRLPLVGGKKFQSKLSSFAGSGLGLSKVRHFRMPRTGNDDKHEKNPMSNKSKSSVQLNSQTVKVDFNESVDIETAWKQGVALYSSLSCSLRAACRLCGCVGLQELIYCSVCCQPFHGFCLEERDRPKDGCDTWCCLQCHFCHVCYGQSNLLQCDKCQESYHPECLGPDYVAKPSRRKRIWVCSKCVRCHSCGATTPGHEKDAVWMCDFSLCYSCGLSMEKDKFCPVCCKCYTDDDWDSKMIQCFTCHTWVHSKCEELTDEMLQIVTYMPDDMPFNCRVCCPSRPIVWEVLIKREMNEGMKKVLDALVQCQLSSLLRRIKMKLDNSLLSTKDNGYETEKQNNGYDEHSGNRTECPDEHLQIHFSVSNSTNRNSNAQVKPKSVHLPTGSSTLLAVPVTNGEDDETTGHQDLVKSNKNLKTVTSSDTEVVEPSDATCTLIGGHCISSGAAEANEGEKTGDRQMSSDLVSPILDLNEALLTVTALDNVCPQSKSVFSSGGKLRSLLELSRDTAKEPLKDIPCDLKEIRAKLEKENGYGSIEEFAADVASIIHYNVELKEDDDEESVSLRTRACASMHALFVKQMEKCFPWFNMRNSRVWSSTGCSLNSGVLDQTVHPPSRDHTYAHWLEKEAIPPPPQPSLFRSIAKDCGPHFGDTVTTVDNAETASVQPEDSRCCAFCWLYGDANDREAGRLVSAGQDDWVHVNCALWSAEVYEEVDGTLQMVHAALARSRKLRCDLCGKPGATVGCCQPGCNSNFHFSCARRKNCAFLETKKVFCELHWMAVDANLIVDGNFAISRRICVDPMSSRLTKRQWAMGIDPSNINILIGSLVVECLGRLSPLSDSKMALLPVDFRVSRLFWSTEDPRQRSIYVCRIVEVIPKAEAPEVINDVTVVHDTDDPSYDLRLATSFMGKGSESDESTLSAVEDALDLSDNEIEAFTQELPNARCDQKGFGSNLPQTLGSSVALRSDLGVSGYPRQLGSNNRHPEWMNLEMPNIEPSFSGVIKDNLLKSSSHSRLSTSTLKTLRNKAQSIESTSILSTGNDGGLGKIKSRLYESVAKNRMQEFHKETQEGDGASSLCNYADEGSPKAGEMSFDLARIGEAAQFGNRMGRSETVAGKNLIQMDGPVGESDSEGSNSEDLSLGAENERNWGPEGKDLFGVFPAKCSLPFASVETDTAQVKYDGSDENCFNSKSLVDSRFPSHYTENSKISDRIFSKQFHIMSDAKKTEENEVSALSGESVALNCNDASFKLPLLQHRLSLPMTLPTLPADAELKTELGVLSDVRDSSLRSVVVDGGELQPSTIAGLNSTVGIAPRLPLPCASEGTAFISPQIRFALSQLLNTNNVSYLGNVAVNKTNAVHLQQVVGNLQFPVQQTRVPSLFTHVPQPVALGISSCPQIQVAPSGSLFPPLILQSLQQMLRASLASQPLFLRLSNCSSVGQPSLSGSSSASFVPPVNQLEQLSTWPSTALGMLPTRIRTEFGNNFHDAISHPANSQTVRPTRPVSVGVKRHLVDSSEDVHSKRMRPANAGEVALNSTSDHFHSSPLYAKRLLQSNSTVYNVKYGDGPQTSLRQDHSSSAVSHGKKKSLVEQPASQNSSKSSLSKVLGISNCGEGHLIKVNTAKKSQPKAASANNRKSKPEPMFEPHPMFRPHLPEAEMEEEIENSPLLALLETEEQRLKEEAEQKKNAPRLMFEITSSDGFHVRSDSLNKAWKAVTDGVQDARLSAGMKPVSFVGIDGLCMTALNHPAVVYLVEQLPGFKRFSNYKFKYHPSRLDEEDDEIIENPHGCARAKPLYGWRKCETFSFLLSRYRTRPEYDPTAAYRENITANKSQRRSTSLDLPMAMRFRHLRIFAKEAVGVYRSNIHGRGLFCRRDIDAGEMIIEYSGEVIRAILTDKREKRYESKAMGCYMFRKDRDHVIDSTMMGNAARFINHSCDPNCYSKVILVDNRKHIVIFAQRPIRRGEELTYDYKFPIEDVKIPCTCGSRRCRKYLN